MIYADIVQVIVPSQAMAGETVNIEVKVKNLYPTTSLYITAAARVVDSGVNIELHFGSEAAVVGIGNTHTFYDSFTMPNSSVTIWIWSFWWGADSQWHQDDETTRSISLGVFEELEGTISRKELEYNESRANIPALGIPQGQEGKVHIWGRNDTDSSQKLAIAWAIADPDGLIVQEYTDSEFGTTSPSGVHEFIGSERFNLSKVGDYWISVNLLMESNGAWVIVDSYINQKLCTVVAEVFEATIFKKELEYNGEQKAIPVSNVPSDSWGKIHIWGKSVTGGKRLGIAWAVADPDGVVIDSYTDWEAWPWTGAGDTHEFIGSERFDLDKVGDYWISVNLLVDIEGEVVIVDSYISKKLCTTIPGVPLFSLFQITDYVVV